MRSPDSTLLECRTCLRRLPPKLRAVGCGLLLVCPHCLAPHRRPDSAGQTRRGKLTERSARPDIRL